MSDAIAQVIPMYFVADESGSMRGVVGDVNRGLVSLLDTLSKQTMAAAMIRFCVLGFADEPTCHLAMSDLRDVEKMPTLTANGGTSYERLFRELGQRIQKDAAKLNNHYIVLRPVVYFLTDGHPNRGEDWETPLKELSTMPEHPTILAFGIGEAEPSTILQVASKADFAFIAAEGNDIGTLVERVMENLIGSVVATGSALAEGRSELQVERPAGFTMAIDSIYPAQAASAR